MLSLAKRDLSFDVRAPTAAVLLRSVTQALRLAPTVGKVVALLLLLLNAGSWPFVCHATHFHFIREIPMFARYEVRASVGA
ncbi:hypothetical protein FB451DRAFT_1414784 [Mycena latifolia]|nr:hypothetical protein FB451DRAFT_1414784 [Mycena latifolia]